MNTPKDATHDDEVLKGALRILHLEDNEDDRYLIQNWLSSQLIAAKIISVDNERDFVRAFEDDSYDLVLSDNALPGFDGLSALRFVREMHPEVPFVFVTGSMGEEAAIETMKVGAADYVLKDKLARLVPAISRAIRDARQAAHSRRMEEKNREQATLLNKAQDAIVVIDINDRIRFWNKSAERLYGRPAFDVIGRRAPMVLPASVAAYQEAKRIVLQDGNWMGELVSASGHPALIVESRWTLVSDDDGRPRRILIIDTDVTARKAIESKFLRAQRMDSIGALAGGIAHDLNNALAPVLMSTELLRDSRDERERAEFLELIHANARRAADLVNQILGFARGSSNGRGNVQVKKLVQEMGKTIQSTFPKSISFGARLPENELWSVHGDSTEIHQVLLNLSVNARDAMPKGGALKITVKNCDLTAEQAAAGGAKERPYIMISVADTGSGIPPEIMSRIFEPFFTTKSGEKGTGLGLFTVSEIVKRHGGFMEIQSRPQEGTDFRVYLPAVQLVKEEQIEPAAPPLPEGRGELILVIDDEKAVRELTRTALETYGYRVITAQNGLQGIASFRENARDIKLLVTDTDMPQMDGMAAVRVIKELSPKLPVIVASGSTRRPEEAAEIDAMGLKNLGKPYSLDQLLVAVDTGLHQ